MDKVAVHEAGHAVAVAVHGGTMPFVTAATMSTRIGDVVYLAPGANTYAGLSPGSERLALLSGAAAEVVFIDQLCLSTGVLVKSEPRVKRCIDAVITVHEVDLAGYRRASKCDSIHEDDALAALNLVETRWSDVVAVGEALCASATRTIPFDQVRKIVGRA